MVVLTGAELTSNQREGYRLAAAALVALAVIQVALGWLGPRGTPRIAGPVLLLVLAWGLRRGNSLAALAVLLLSVASVPIALLGAWQRGGAAAGIVAISETAAPLVFALLLVGQPDVARRRFALRVFAALIVLPSAVALLMLR